MRKVLLLLILCLPASAQIFGNYKWMTISPSGSNYNLTGVTAAAGSTIWVFAGTPGQCYGSTWSFNDGAGNTYTQIGTNVSRTYACGAQFYAKNVSALSNATLVITASGGWSTLRAGYIEIVSAHTTAPLDDSKTANDDAPPPH